jgi:hypothetical protein
MLKSTDEVADTRLAQMLTRLKEILGQPEVNTRDCCAGVAFHRDLITIPRRMRLRIRYLRRGGTEQTCGCCQPERELMTVELTVTTEGQEAGTTVETLHKRRVVLHEQPKECGCSGGVSESGLTVARSTEKNRDVYVGGYSGRHTGSKQEDTESDWLEDLAELEAVIAEIIGLAEEAAAIAAAPEQQAADQS